MVERYRLKSKPKSKRRIMREFSIAELSAVDKPAQKHATMTIMKRAEDVELQDRIDVMQKRIDDLTEVINKRFNPSQPRVPSGQSGGGRWAGNGSGLGNARFGQSKPNSSSALARMRAINHEVTMLRSDARMYSNQNFTQSRLAELIAERAGLARQSKLDYARFGKKDENFKSAGTDAGDGNGSNTGEKTMTAAEKSQIEDLEKQITDLVTKLETATAGSGDENVAALQDELAAATEKSEELAKKLADASAELDIAKMSDEEKEHLESLDDEGKGKFRGLSASQRKQAMKKRLDDDEVIEVGGRSIRKSVIGEDHFEVIKSQQAQIAEQDEALVEERNRRETVELTKRAEDDLEHLPGTVDEKIEILQGISKMEDGPRAALEAMLKVGDKAVSAAFQKIGHTGEQKVANAAAFNKRVSEIKAREKCSGTEAMAKARDEFPDEFAAFQNSGN